MKLHSSSPVLGRFVPELFAQSPHPLPPAPRLTALAPLDVEAARIGWAARVVDEYRSVVVFSDLLRLLADGGAPFAALCAVQRLIGDELRHVALCVQANAWLGGMDDLDLDLSDLGLPPSEDAPLVRALDVIVRELCVAETESVAVLRAYRDAATEPSCAALLQTLLTDEVRHAAAGRVLSDALLATFPEAEREHHAARLRTLADADRAALRAGYLQTFQGGPGRALGVSLLPRDLAYGEGHG